MSRVLVDTNVVVWMLLSEQEHLTQSAINALEDQQSSIHVSAISVWEIAIKRSLGKFEIEGGWAEAIPRIGLQSLPVTALHAQAVESLPWHHRDPFDRLLVAQALTEEMPVISADDMLGRYDVQIIW